MTNEDYEDDKVAAMMQSLVPPNDQRASPRDKYEANIVATKRETREPPKGLFTLIE
jgi:hypothetical protein